MNQFHLAVELTPAGLHPAAWRLPSQDAAGAFTARHWLSRAHAAQRAGASLVFVDDSAAAPVERPGAFVGSLDAVGIAALLGPLTAGIGLVPVVPVTYREPFHVGKEIQTLDRWRRGVVDEDERCAGLVRGLRVAHPVPGGERAGGVGRGEAPGCGMATGGRELDGKMELVHGRRP